MYFNLEHEEIRKDNDLQTKSYHQWMSEIRMFETGLVQNPNTILPIQSVQNLDAISCHTTLSALLCYKRPDFRHLL